MNTPILKYMLEKTCPCIKEVRQGILDWDSDLRTFYTAICIVQDQFQDIAKISCYITLNSHIAKMSHHIFCLKNSEPVN